jgi:hypothetical protein
MEAFWGQTRMADQVGFELAVRLEKFAVELSTEFPPSLAKFGFRENFAPEVLGARFHLSLHGPALICLLLEPRRRRAVMCGRAVMQW